MEPSSAPTSSRIVITKLKHLQKCEIDGQLFKMVMIEVPESSKEISALMDIIDSNLHICQIQHPNILKVYFNGSTEDPSYQRVYIEKIDGKLSNYLESQKELLASSTNYLVSDALIEIVRCMIDAISYIHSWGEYHGNISLDSFYYKLNGMKPLIKLACFTANGMIVEAAQLDDWHKMGSSILPDMISILENNLDSKSTISMLKDLVDFFRDIRHANDAKIVYKMAFFMGIDDQIQFFRISLHYLASNHLFLQQVERPLQDMEHAYPWDLGTYEPLVNYVSKWNDQIYLKDNIGHFLMALSAIYEQYVHITELQGSNFSHLGSLTDLHIYMLDRYPNLIGCLRKAELGLHR